jgi:hypothetical protein
MAYQHSPQASKGNAFCWHTWSPLIQWAGDSSKAAGHQKRMETLEAKRASGNDHLFIAGLSSHAKQNPLDAARFAIAEVARRAARRA